mmetsp:Transcript_22667/g.59243  ORF Transcript_22667/g.59243 Transcript_22667/m.59243 type:complete len:253 (-) Transcript_22667:206-964(-)
MYRVVCESTVEIPKSAIWARRNSSSSTLSGLMSRTTTPASCSCCSVCAKSCITRRRKALSSGRGSTIRAARLVAYRFMTRHIWRSISHVPRSWHTPVAPCCAVMCALSSRSNCARASSAVISGRILTATSRSLPRVRSTPPITLPKDPRPMSSSGTASRRWSGSIASGCSLSHAWITFRSARLRTRLADVIGSRVNGDTGHCCRAVSIAARSYVWPSVPTTGSCSSSSVMGHRKSCGGSRSMSVIPLRRPGA